MVLEWMSSGRCGSFFSHDFGLPRTGSSSVVHSGSLDSLNFVLGHFFLLDVGLGFEMEWAEASRTFWPHTCLFALRYSHPPKLIKTLLDFYSKTSPRYFSSLLIFQFLDFVLDYLKPRVGVGKTYFLAKVFNFVDWA